MKCSPCDDQVLPKQSKKEKLVSQLKAHYPTLENQPESFINEAIPLILIDDSTVELTKNGEQNNLYLHLARNFKGELTFRKDRASLTRIH